MSRSRFARAAMLAAAVSMLVLGGCEQPPWVRSRTFLFGGRIPRSYFVAQASAESDDEPEAGCRDEAWVSAGLGEVNVTANVFSLPAEAREIAPPNRLARGALLDAAVAEISGARGECLTAAVRIVRVRVKKTGEQIGGLIVTYNGHAGEAEVSAQLDEAVLRAFRRRWPGDDCELIEPKTVIRSLTPRKKFGTVLVAVVFADVLHPQAGGPTEFKSLREIISE